jgi:hypothetical protein
LFFFAAWDKAFYIVRLLETKTHFLGLNLKKFILTQLTCQDLILEMSQFDGLKKTWQCIKISENTVLLNFTE